VTTEKGVRRLVWVVSIGFALFVGAGLFVMSLRYTGASLQSSLQWGPALIAIVVAGAIPWAVFYIGRWIVQGFRDRGL